MDCEYLIIAAFPYLFYLALLGGLLANEISKAFPYLMSFGWLWVICIVLIGAALLGVILLFWRLQDKFNKYMDEKEAKRQRENHMNTQKQNNMPKERTNGTVKKPSKSIHYLIISLAVALLISIGLNIFFGIKSRKPNADIPVNTSIIREQKTDTTLNNYAIADSIQENQEILDTSDYYSDIRDSLFDSIVRGVDDWAERTESIQSHSSKRMVCVYGISGDSIIEECYEAPEINLERETRNYGMYIYPQDEGCPLEISILVCDYDLPKNFVEKVTKWGDVNISFVLYDENHRDSIRIDKKSTYTKYNSNDTIAFLYSDVIYWCPF